MKSYYEVLGRKIENHQEELEMLYRFQEWVDVLRLLVRYFDIGKDLPIIEEYGYENLRFLFDEGIRIPEALERIANHNRILFKFPTKGE